MQEVAAAVLAAGYGKIDGQCKLLAEINGQPLINRVVESLKAAKVVGEIYLVVNEESGDQIRESLRNFDNLKFVLQPYRMGTAGATRLVLDILPERYEKLLCTFADMGAWRPSTYRRLVKRSFKKGGADLTLAVVQPPEGSNIERYGRVLKKDGKVLMTFDAWEIDKYRNNPEIMELLRAATETNPSLYAFGTRFLRHAMTQLKPVNKGDGHPDELLLQHTVEIAAREGFRIAEIKVKDHREALGINDKQELEEVRTIFRTWSNLVTTENQPSYQIAA